MGFEVFVSLYSSVPLGMGLGLDVVRERILFSRLTFHRGAR